MGTCNTCFFAQDSLTKYNEQKCCNLLLWHRIVPYVNPTVTGSISGIIGAGGNVGAVAFSFCFRELNSRKAFLVMGSIIIASSICSAFIKIEGHVGYLCQEEDDDNEEVSVKNNQFGRRIKTTCLDDSATDLEGSTGPTSSTVRVLPGTGEYPAISV